MRDLVWIKGAGDLATGVAFRLLQARFPVVLSELAEPLCVRRQVSFAEAVIEGHRTVEGYTGVRVTTVDEVFAALAGGQIPVLADPAGQVARRAAPAVVVDAIMAKRNTGTRLGDAPAVIAMGPGFVAGVDCHAVIETQRGHSLGRVIYHGAALPDTGIPGSVDGVDSGRVLRSTTAGIFSGLVEIGALVGPGDRVGEVCTDAGEQLPVVTNIGGVVRGLLRTGTRVPAGLKVGDVDPTGELNRCHTISDKALAIGGGVLEAILRLRAIETPAMAE